MGNPFVGSTGNPYSTIVPLGSCVDSRDLSAPEIGPMIKLLTLLPLVLALAAGAPSTPSAPRIVVLGTVQDGGMPQTGCDCAHCSAARKNPALARHVASLAIYIPKTDHVYLIDATPDLPAQIETIHTFHHHPQRPEGKTDRAPVDGVLLT